MNKKIKVKGNKMRVYTGLTRALTLLVLAVSLTSLVYFWFYFDIYEDVHVWERREANGVRTKVIVQTDRHRSETKRQERSAGVTLSIMGVLFACHLGTIWIVFSAASYLVTNNLIVRSPNTKPTTDPTVDSPTTEESATEGDVTIDDLTRNLLQKLRDSKIR